MQVDAAAILVCCIQTNVHAEISTRAETRAASCASAQQPLPPVAGGPAVMTCNVLAYHKTLAHIMSQCVKATAYHTYHRGHQTVCE